MRRSSTPSTRLTARQPRRTRLATAQTRRCGARTALTATLARRRSRRASAPHITSSAVRSPRSTSTASLQSRQLLRGAMSGSRANVCVPQVSSTTEAAPRPRRHRARADIDVHRCHRASSKVTGSPRQDPSLWHADDSPCRSMSTLLQPGRAAASIKVRLARLARLALTDVLDRFTLAVEGIHSVKDGGVQDASSAEPRHRRATVLGPSRAALE